MTHKEHIWSDKSVRGETEITMPGMDFEEAAKANESPVLGSLKARNAMRQTDRTEDKPQRLTQAGRRRSPPAPLKTGEGTSHPTSDRVRSWMRESSDIQAIPIIGQPLTPPINFRDNFKSWIDDKALRDREFLSQQKISPGNTPLVANSPPTPETTPPRQVYHFAASSSQPASRNVSNGSVGTVRYAPESTTGSFQTARENLVSDDESRPSDSPSLHPSRRKWLRDAGLLEQRDVGLGLGLESDNDEPPTPTGAAPINNEMKKNKDLVTFDGTWASDTPKKANEPKSVAAAQRDLQKSGRSMRKKDLKTGHLDSPTLGIEAKLPSKRSSKGKRKSDQSRGMETGESNQETRERVQSPWPLKDNSIRQKGAHNDTQFDDIHAKRLSQASTTSAIVEALVIESPPQRRQTLRHTGRMMRLDSSNRQQTLSTRESLQSDPHLLKKQLRSIKRSDQGSHRHSTSETSQAGAQRSALAKLEGASVVVVPDRRASIQSSTESGKHISRTFSINSKQQSSRPTTAPEDAVGYFDVPRQERRTVSVVIQKATPSKAVKTNVNTTSPGANAETFASTAAASRELLRTTSATSGGLATHYIPETPTSHGSITPHTVDPHENQVISINRSNSGDWSTLRPRSALVTPMSLRSAHSSTPGMLEVNEATAISIYPHTNKSILVIQESAGKDDVSPREQSAMIAENASIALPSAFAPVITHSVSMKPHRELTNSPLQNPREPPQPPDFKIIPPTPANAASSSEDTVHNDKLQKRSSRFNAPFASLRRAMSARRYHESISNPFAFSRTLSSRDIDGRQRSSPMEDPKDRQLHPFWRPRSFWDDDDGTDSDSEFGNNGTLSPRRPSSHGNAFRSSNAPRRSQSLTRRFAGSFRSPSNHRPILRRKSISLTSDIIPNPITGGNAASVESRPPTSKRSLSLTTSHYLPTPKRTLSLTTPNRSYSLSRKIGGSFRLPSKGATLHRRPQRSTTAYWHDQPNYEFIRPDDNTYMPPTTSTEAQPQPQSRRHHHQPSGDTVDHQHPYHLYDDDDERQPPQHSTVGSSLRNFAERLERRRSVREEGRREERRTWLKARIGFVGVNNNKGADILDGFDMVHPPPPPAPAPHAVPGSP